MVVCSTTLQVSSPGLDALWQMNIWWPLTELSSSYHRAAVSHHTHQRIVVELCGSHPFWTFPLWIWVVLPELWHTTAACRLAIKPTTETLYAPNSPSRAAHSAHERVTAEVSRSAAIPEDKLHVPHRPLGTSGCICQYLCPLGIKHSACVNPIETIKILTWEWYDAACRRN